MIPYTIWSCDWSPDVCSSELFAKSLPANVPDDVTVNAIPPPPNPAPAAHFALRSEERRVGKGCRSHNTQLQGSKIIDHTPVDACVVVNAADHALHAAPSNTPFPVFVSA